MNYLVITIIVFLLNCIIYIYIYIYVCVCVRILPIIYDNLSYSLYNSTKLVAH